MSRTGTAQHYSGTAATIATGNAPVQLKRALGQRIIIRNLDATNNLGVSFNGGAAYFYVPPGQQLDVDCLIHQFFVCASASTVAWCAIVIEG